MMHDPVDAPYNDSEEEPAIAQSIPSERFSPKSWIPISALHTLSGAVLAERCTRERTTTAMEHLPMIAMAWRFFTGLCCNTTRKPGNGCSNGTASLC